MCCWLALYNTQPQNSQLSILPFHMLQWCPICIPLVRRRWSRAASESEPAATARGGWLVPGRGTPWPCTGWGCWAGISAGVGSTQDEISCFGGEGSSPSGVNCLMLLEGFYAILVALNPSTQPLSFLELQSPLLFIAISHQLWKRLRLKLTPSLQNNTKILT